MYSEQICDAGYKQIKTMVAAFIAPSISLMYSLMSVVRHWNLKPWFLWQEFWVQQ
jgi:hypothetical protein